MYLAESKFLTVFFTLKEMIFTNYWRLRVISDKTYFDALFEYFLDSCRKGRFIVPSQLLFGRQGADKVQADAGNPGKQKGGTSFLTKLRRKAPTISVRLNFLKCVQIFLSSKTQIGTDLRYWRENLDTLSVQICVWEERKMWTHLRKSRRTEIVGSFQLKERKLI